MRGSWILAFWLCGLVGCAEHAVQDHVASGPQPTTATTSTAQALPADVDVEYEGTASGARVQYVVVDRPTIAKLAWSAGLVNITSKVCTRIVILALDQEGQVVAAEDQKCRVQPGGTLTASGIIDIPAAELPRIVNVSIDLVN
jgi:hypothetical protein